jgi:hypothetical protein
LRDKEGRERIIPTAIQIRTTLPKNPVKIVTGLLESNGAAPMKRKRTRRISRKACPETRIKEAFLPKRALSDTVAVSRGPGIIAPERAIVKDAIKVEIIVIPLKYFPKIIFQVCIGN